MQFEEYKLTDDDILVLHELYTKYLNKIKDNKSIDSVRCKNYHLVKTPKSFAFNAYIERERNTLHYYCIFFDKLLLAHYYNNRIFVNNLQYNSGNYDFTDYMITKYNTHLYKQTNVSNKINKYKRYNRINSDHNILTFRRIPFITHVFKSFHSKFLLTITTKELLKQYLANAKLSI